MYIGVVEVEVQAYLVSLKFFDYLGISNGKNFFKYGGTLIEN